jgi:choline-sulfatase
MNRNIVVFLSDDHAAWAAGCYGNTEIRTPALDHLAETGVLFENAFTPSPVCSPARASFFTGRLPSQHGLHDYLSEADPEVQTVPWLVGERLLPEILQENGYVTGLSGKWHLGNGKESPVGFDYAYCRSAPVSEDSGYTSPWPMSIPAELSYDRHAITDHGIEFLRRRDPARPFFLVIGHLATHSPWSGVPDRLVAQYREATFDDIPRDSTYPFGRQRSESLYPSRNDPREALAQYYGAVTDIDEQVGRILDELDSLKLREDTTIVYTSDHGLNTGHHGIWGKGNATLPYNVVDESIRIPLIINAPGAALGRQRRAENVTHLDTFQTILEIAGCPIPSDDAAAYPGGSYGPVLIGEPLQRATDRVFAEYGNLRMVRTASHKLVRRYPDGPHELFDLGSDPRETTNVINDTGYNAILAALTESLDTYFSRYENVENSGLRVAGLPRHNPNEAWRDTSNPTLTENHDWLSSMENAIQLRRDARAKEPNSTGDWL